MARREGARHMRFSHQRLAEELSAVIDPAFARAAVDAYVETEQRFLAGDWQPAELDGGRLCEAAARTLLQLDTGTVSHSELPRAAQVILLDKNRPHALGEKDRQHITKVIDLVYKFRS